MSPLLPDIERNLQAFYRQGAPANPTATVHDLQAISGGWENEVYSFALAHSAAGSVQEELILRIYPGSDAPRKSAREFDAMCRLREVGFPVPEMHRLELDTAWLGRPFVIMEKIPGRSVDAVFEAASTEKRQELLSLFCRLMVDLHALDWRSVITDGSLAAGDTLALMQRELSGRQASCHSLGQHGFDPVFVWLEERMSQVRWAPPCLTHGDYHGDNVLLRDDGAPFVIDWGNIRVSDRRSDLAWTLLLSSSYGAPEMRAPILQEYERIAGARMEDMEFFDVAACWRRLFSICGSLDQGADQLGMRPGAEGMMQNARHIRAVYGLLLERTAVRLPRIDALLASLTRPPDSWRSTK
jgi:aminoglycoside phosphotransferase (APT) family kinase protein